MSETDTPTLVPTPNAERLRGTLQYIQEHPEFWCQRDWILVKKEPADWPVSWECGTYACFAGWACLLYGKEEGWEHDGSSSALFIKEGSSEAPRHADELACELLGLTSLQANSLFAASNSMERLTSLVDLYA